MGKKTKIALTGSLTMLAAGIGSLFYAGNYLYNLALINRLIKMRYLLIPQQIIKYPIKIEPI